MIQRCNANAIRYIYGVDRSAAKLSLFRSTGSMELPMSKSCVALFNDGWADWESGPVLAGLREYLGCEVRIATPRGQAATSIGGVRAQADLPFGEVSHENLAVLLVIGSDMWTQRDFPEVYELIRKTAAAGVGVGAICAATVAAARAGILNKIPHTSNNAKTLLDFAPVYQGSTFYRDVPQAVRSGNIVTAPGSAPATFAAEILRLVDSEKGPQIAAEFLEMSKQEFVKA